ncbi:MAG: hypothetical protein ACO1N4_03720 [Pedobacter sp.]|jgi:hypothetical protein
MRRAEVIHTIQEMPDEFSAEELIERILLLQKIEEGLGQVEEDNVLSEEEASKRLEKWLK